MKHIPTYIAFILLFVTFQNNIYAQVKSVGFIEYKGKVIDADTYKPMMFANVSVKDENISTVTNTEGKFSLKIPNSIKHSKIIISFMGYENILLDTEQFKKGKHILIKLKPVSIPLNEVSVYPKDAKMIIKKVMSEKSKNYMSKPVLMTNFYREMIKKGHTYVALSEVVFKVYKQSYSNTKSDKVQLIKGRKSNHPTKLDTLLFKLQNGAYSILQLDVVKNPYMLFDKESIEIYDYKLLSITQVNSRLTYIIEFKQKEHIDELMFFGKIYIDVNTFAVSNIQFSFNIENRAKATEFFVKRKPIGVKVYPTSTHYIVSYAKKNDKWIFNYARSETGFKVNWKKRLFNTNYTAIIETAVTDWQPIEQRQFKLGERLKYNTVLNDEISTFYDKDFWGEYNIIEPEKPIIKAIEKIKNKLGK